MSEIPNPVDSTRNLDTRIQVLVTEELRKQLEKERLWLKDTVGLALKILGLAIAVVAGVLTVFGFTTWGEIKSDVKKNALEYVKANVDELVQKSDSETGVKQSLNDLMNESIVNARMTELARKPGKVLELSQSEWNRLKDWIKLPKLGDQQFSDVIVILNSQSSARKKADANSILSDMLNPIANSPYEWIKKQPTKRFAIMSGFMHLDMGSSALAVAKPPNSMEERVLAIKYIGEIGYRESLSILMNMVTEPAASWELKESVLVACAKMEPTNSAFVEGIGENVKDPLLPTQKVPREKLRILTTVLFELLKKRGGDDAEVLNSLNQSIFEFCIRHGIELKASNRIGKSDVFGTDSNYPFKIVGCFPRSLLDGDRTPFSLTVEEFERYSPYWNLLATLANSKDAKAVEAIQRLKIARTDLNFLHGRAIRVEVNMQEGSKIIVSSSEKKLFLIKKMESKIFSWEWIEGL